MTSTQLSPAGAFAEALAACAHERWPGRPWDVEITVNSRGKPIVSLRVKTLTGIYRENIYTEELDPDKVEDWAQLSVERLAIRWADALRPWERTDS